ncbi:hypothetical protein FEM48_Zijuj10G0141800 [Ziziphus jujuba var. spinosa]|uniref:Chromo domain-containing protein n=1 Tax=Ziziphus jujuba var. spinosa TaxID=714518 RepID=A0A978UNV0_ZIZJJ|nr:hypothetical protein FEM48_Zijuj10G0141800 [Ziziphus jujuba var. spinosa]
MELQERVEKLEKSLDALATGKKDLLCHITERLEKISQLFLGRNTQEMGENSTPGSHRFQGKTAHSAPQRTTTSLSNFIPMTVKLDFPKYDGKEDPTTWVCSVDHFFALHEITEANKVTLASFYLEGDTQLWFQMLEQEIMYVTWEELKNGLFTRFGSNQFEDQFGELIKLRQTGTVLDYQSAFEKLLSKVRPLSQERKVSCFTTRLKDSIRTDVLAHQPTTLTMAIGLAKLFEARDQAQRKPEASWEEDDDEEMAIENDTEPKISLHAMAGIQAPKTMRIWGGLKGHSMVALIDSGSTHNFIRSQIAHQTGIQPNFPTKLKVEFKKGGENIIADALSRRYEVGENMGAVLKKQIGDKQTVLESLPKLDQDGLLVPTPQAILDQRKRKGKNEVLIHWQGLSPAESTWEIMETIQEHFPEFTLEDKADSRHEACEPINCGSGPNISYPFYIEDAGLDFCGQPGFKVWCHKKKPMYRTSRAAYIIEDISYENQSLRLVDEEVVDATCYAPSRYFTFDHAPIDFSPTHANLQFFYGCNESFSLRFEKKLIPCKSDATHLSYVAMRGGSSVKQAAADVDLRMNKEYVFVRTVPILQTAKKESLATRQ